MFPRLAPPSGNNNRDPSNRSNNYSLGDDNDKSKTNLSQPGFDRDFDGVRPGKEDVRRKSSRRLSHINIKNIADDGPNEIFFFNLVQNLNKTERLEKAARHLMDALSNRPVRHSLDCRLFFYRKCSRQESRRLSTDFRRV